MYSLMEEWIEYLDYIEETTQPSDFLWPNDTPSFREFEFSAVDVPAAFSPEKECPRKRYFLVFSFSRESAVMYLLSVF